MALLLSALIAITRVEFTEIFSFVIFSKQQNCILGAPEKLICFERIRVYICLGSPRLGRVMSDSDSTVENAAGCL
jgi:hypothetical protein